MNVVCRCGYRGDQMVEYETKTAHKQLVEWVGTSYYNVMKTALGHTTLNWACPKCGRILMQHRGGWSYNHSEWNTLRRRLWHNSFANETWLRSHKPEAPDATASV